MKFEDVKKKAKEHKKEIALVALGTVGACFGLYYWKRALKPTIIESINNNWYNGAVNGCEIDEKIFTGLACTIEDAVLEEGLGEAFIEEVYNVDFAKGGDIANGIYTVAKNVEVTIRNVE